MSFGVQCEQCKAFFKVTQADLRPPLNWVTIEIGTNAPVHCCSKRCAAVWLTNN